LICPREDMSLEPSWWTSNLSAQEMSGNVRTCRWNMSTNSVPKTLSEDMKMSRPWIFVDRICYMHFNAVTDALMHFKVVIDNIQQPHFINQKV
jgi:hypothetical protein